MSAQSNAPVIYKRVKKISAEGHHGGAWKVAYADFVTAMMAFFMLMWLLNATTETQRKGIADYFSPTIPIMRASGGGEGAFGGDSVFIEEILAHSGHGGVPSTAAESGDGGGQGEAGDEAEALGAVQDLLSGKSGESMVSELAARHIVTELSDEGLIIELFDAAGEPLFHAESAEPTALLEDLIAVVAEVVDLVVNGIAIEGHVAALPVVRAENANWSLSAERADRVRQMLEQADVAPGRILRVTGHADRKPAVANPMAVRNNRLTLILLRHVR